jgi:hypothetical protein
VISVPKQYADGVSIEYAPDKYEYKRGNAASGVAWYWPEPRTPVAVVGDLEWYWQNAGVQFGCEFHQVGPFSWLYLQSLAIEGYAQTLIETESQRLVSGGGGGDDDGTMECYEIWLEWRDPETGVLLDEQFTGAYYCPGGNME